MTSLFDLTISIVSHGHGMFLDRLLDDLNGGGVIGQSRIIVTINVPDSTFPGDKWGNSPIEWILNNVPKGFGANHNNALFRASTSWVLVLNPDIRIARGTLNEMLALGSGCSNLGIMAPRIVDRNGKVEDSVRSNLSPASVLWRALPRLLFTQQSELSITASHWFAGMFLLMPRDVFLELRGFDERFFLYCEDYDICVRACLSGRRLVLDDVHAVVHDARRASRWRLKYFVWHVRSLLLVWCSLPFWKYTLSLIFRLLPAMTRVSDHR